MIKNEIAGIYDIKADADGVRLDNFLAQKIDGVSRSYIKN